MKAVVIATDGEILYRALFAGDAGVENAIAAVAAGEQPTKKSSQSLLPVFNSLGFMHDTVVRAGAGAYSDMVKIAPPMVAGWHWQQSSSHSFRRRSAASPC